MFINENRELINKKYNLKGKKSLKNKKEVNKFVSQKGIKCMLKNGKNVIPFK